MVVTQGDIRWADLPEPVGSMPGFRRPVVVVQSDAYNRARIATVVCVPLTTNMRWADSPGNVLLAADETDLPHDSVANVTQIFAADQEMLVDWVRRVPRDTLDLVLHGIDVLLGR